MTSSQDNATAAALHALGIDFKTEVAVTDVVKNGPSAGKLQRDDVLLRVDDAPVSVPASLVDAIQSVKPGTTIRLGVRRDGADRTITVTTRPDEQDKSKSRIGVGIRQTYRFPFKVKVRLPDTIGGPSAGMMFALAIYDVLTPGSLTGGKVIAGSGEIGPDGTVGAIGGIGQKLPAAQRDGAKLFLVDADNCAEAVRSHYDPDKMRLVKVHTLAEAIKDVETWRDNPNADLPRCTS